MTWSPRGTGGVKKCGIEMISSVQSLFSNIRIMLNWMVIDYWEYTKYPRRPFMSSGECVFNYPFDVWDFGSWAIGQIQ